MQTFLNLYFRVERVKNSTTIRASFPSCTRSGASFTYLTFTPEELKALEVCAGDTLSVSLDCGYHWKTYDTDTELTDSAHSLDIVPIPGTLRRFNEVERFSNFQEPTGWTVVRCWKYMTPRHTEYHAFLTSEEFKNLKVVYYCSDVLRFTEERPLEVGDVIKAKVCPKYRTLYDKTTGKEIKNLEGKEFLMLYLRDFELLRKKTPEQIEKEELISPQILEIEEDNETITVEEFKEELKEYNKPSEFDEVLSADPVNPSALSYQEKARLEDPEAFEKIDNMTEEEALENSRQMIKEMREKEEQEAEEKRREEIRQRIANERIRELQEDDEDEGADYLEFITGEKPKQKQREQTPTEIEEEDPEVIEDLLKKFEALAVQRMREGCESFGTRLMMYKDTAAVIKEVQDIKDGKTVQRLTRMILIDLIRTLKPPQDGKD